jgi:subtilisin family serine protease
VKVGQEARAPNTFTHPTGGVSPMVQVKKVLARAGSVLLLMAAAAACTDDQPAATRGADDAREPTFNVRSRSPRDVPEVKIDLPAKPRPWDNNPAALATAIAEGEGFAVVAFKEAGNGRALATGRRGAVTAGTVRAGVELLQRSGAEILDLLDAIGGARVRISPQAAAEISGHPLVDFIEPRQYGQAQSQTLPVGITLVQANDFWTSSGGYAGAGAKIEIVDTGYQPGHPDLPTVPTANCSGVFGGCDDSSTANWHGTHVMGIITARNNSEGVVGAAPGLAAGDIYVYGACASTGSCPTDQVTAGINAGIWNVDIMNLSLVQPFNLAQSTAVAQAWSSGILIVAAAGNNLTETVTYPAGYANVIGVSGVGPDKSFASTSACGNYSNQGSHVDLAAPFEAYSTMGTNTYGTQCGTSMAAAHVTGVAALLKSQNPSWTNQQIANALFARAEDLGPAGRDNQFGHGLVMPVKPTLPEVIIGGTSSISAAGTHSWTAYPSGGNGAYAYTWHYRVRGTSTWTPVGYGQTYSRAVGGSDPSFDLRVMVTSGGMSASDAHLVDVVLPPSVSIGGTSAINSAGTHTWYANASGGNGSYGYSWEYRTAGGAWSYAGSGSSYSRAVNAGDPHFELRVTVTSAGLTGAPATHSVAVNLTPPVSVYIEGPGYVYGGQTNWWSAIASGGTGAYTYQWQVSYDGSSWSNVGTSSWYSRTDSNYGLSYYLRVTVTSGGLSATSDELYVYVQPSNNNCNQDSFSAQRICLDSPQLQ